MSTFTKILMMDFKVFHENYYCYSYIHMDMETNASVHSI